MKPKKVSTVKAPKLKPMAVKNPSNSGTNTGLRLYTNAAASKLLTKMG